MKTLGVTGGIGSGKTTVCRLLEDLGARVFYADAEAKRLMQDDPDTRDAVVAAFGPSSYDAEGRLDRAYLAGQVFGDPDNVARINAIVHPRVLAAFEQAKAKAARDGVALLVHEAALIFESGGDRHLDAVAVVDAPEQERIRRVVARDGVTPEQVRARMAHQLPADDLRRRADYVIENSGPPEALRARVEAVYQAMVDERGESKRGEEREKRREKGGGKNDAGMQGRGDAAGTEGGRRPSSSIFKDHFSAHAAAYARYRPAYPDALYAFVASRCAARDLAWDCGTGNGQAALGMASHFEQVVATDASAEQIAHATRHDRITYHVTPETVSPLADASADLVTVAQALHWFDFDTFYAEVRRVLRPGGVLAVWTYTLQHVSPAVDAAVHTLYEDLVGPYWPPERRYVEAGYRTLPFPFADDPTPAFHMERRWTLAEFIGYLGTWSATQRYAQARGTDPVAQIRDDLARAWGDPETAHTVRWPLHLRLGRKPG